MSTEFDEQQLKRQLTELEEETSRFRYDRSTLLNNIADEYKKHGNDLEAQNIRYEAAAFMLCERGDSFPCYFQPMAVFTNGKTSPPLEFFTREALKYLEKRATNTQNPIIASRFADVVWDLSTPKGPDTARLAVDKYLECATIYKKNIWGLELSTSIKRATQLATMLNDLSRLTRVKEAIMKQLVEFDEKKDYRFCIDLGEAICASTKLKLSKDEAKKVEEVLNSGAKYYQEDHDDGELCLGPTGAPNEHLVRSLLESILNLSSEGHLVEINRNLYRVEIARSHEREGDRALKDTNYLAAVFFLHEAEKHFMNLGMSTDRDRVRVKLARAGLKSEEDFKVISVSTEIDKAKIEEYIRPLIAGTIEESIKIIVSAPHFIPSIGKVQKFTEKLQQEYPLSSLGHQISLQEGHIIGSFAKDSEKRKQAIVGQLVLEIQISNIFLRNLFDKLIKELGLNAEILAKHFEEWGHCEQRNILLLKKGFKHYFQGDYIAALHILIPQFEDTLRSLLQKAHRPISRPGHGVACLGSLLAEEGFVAAAGVDLMHYYKVVLDEPAGINLRNNLSHGLLDPESMTRERVETIIHLLLTLTRFAVGTAE